MAETIYWTEATEAGPTLYGSDVETELSAGQWGMRIGLHAMLYGTRSELMAFLHRAAAEITASAEAEHENVLHIDRSDPDCPYCSEEAPATVGRVAR